MNALNLNQAHQNVSNDSPLSVAAIVLAAGCSRRMGVDNKLLLDHNGSPLVRCSVENAIASAVQSTFVVLGHDAGSVAEALEGLTFEPVSNTHYSQGMSSSLSAGVNAARGFDAVAILLADMPLIASATIDVLLQVLARQDAPAIIVPARGGRRGHPVIWPAVLFQELMQLNGDTGGKSLLQKYSDLVLEVSVSTDTIFIDIDTPADMEVVQVSSGSAS